MMNCAGVGCLLLFLVFPVTPLNIAPTELAELMKKVTDQKDGYGVFGQYSLAVRVALKDNIPDFEKLLQEEPAKNVKDQMINSNIYKGKRIVGAKPLLNIAPRQHSEYRLLTPKGKSPLDHLWKQKANDDLMVFYTKNSPCDQKCTNVDSKHSILTPIEIIKKWPNYAFVFTTPFKPSNNWPGETPTPEKLKASLKELNKHISNIFRCDQSNTGFKCINCENMWDECVKEKMPI